MTILVAHHKVVDYDQWKAVFDEVASIRKAFGSTGSTVLRNTADPNELMIITEWPSAEQAHSYSESSELRAAFQRAGLTTRPNFYVMEEADRQPA
jgi:heme-degrading monooxygenase HmoA